LFAAWRSRAMDAPATSSFPRSETSFDDTVLSSRRVTQTRGETVR
jgi:hypothetical protein